LKENTILRQKEKNIARFVKNWESRLKEMIWFGSIKYITKMAGPNFIDGRMQQADQSNNQQKAPIYYKE